MEKFKKGDRVVSASGARGVVDEAFGNGQYAVLFDGRSTPDRVEGFKLRLANARALNSTRPIVQRALNASVAGMRVVGNSGFAKYADSALPGLEYVKWDVSRRFAKHMNELIHWIDGDVYPACKQEINNMCKALAEDITDEERQKLLKAKAGYEQLLAKLKPIRAQFEAIRVTKNSAVATNEAGKESKNFSPSVSAECYPPPHESWAISLNMNGLCSPYSAIGAADCIAKAEAVVKALEEKKQGMLKAIAWIRERA